VVQQELEELTAGSDVIHYKQWAKTGKKYP
jgi:hypothetical protein